MTSFHARTPKGCPPKDALAPNEIMYRIVFSDPPSSDDFIIWIEEPEYQHLLDDKKYKVNCRDFAISMFNTETGAERVYKLFKSAFLQKAKLRKSNFIGFAEVMLDQNCGMLKQTTNDLTHHDLWPYITSKPECNVHSLRKA